MARTRSGCAQCLRSNLFVILLITCVAIGIVMGIGLRYLPTPWTKLEIHYLKFPGEMLLRMLKMLIIPLVVSSMIVGISSLDTKASGKIGLRAIIFYLSTTLLSVILGIFLVAIIAPGKRGTSGQIRRTGKSKSSSAANSFLDLIRNAIPDNIFSATFEKTVSVLSQVPIAQTTLSPQSTLASDTSMSTTEATYLPPVMETLVKVSNASGSNLFGIIVFSIAFACAISLHGERTRTVRSFFDGCNEAIHSLVRLVLWYSPIGICFLIASKIVEMQDPLDTLTQLAFYMATVIAGLLIHGLIILPLIYLIAVRKNPFKYMYGCMEALILAVSTASSSATLPITMRCVEEVNGVDPRISRFVLPVGATINMDGTALYEAVAAIFIAQVNNRELDPGQYVIISLTATAAAIGAAGIPEAGLITMAIVLSAVGLPVEDVTLILAIDWFLDRLRTTVNVWGDAVGAAVIERMSRDQLTKMDQQTGLEKGIEIEIEEDVPNGSLNQAFTGSPWNSDEAVSKL